MALPSEKTYGNGRFCAMNTLYLASFGDFVERIGELCELIYSKALALPMIVCLLGTGVLLTFRNKFKQVTKFPTAFKSTFGPTFKSIGASLKDYKFPLEKRMDVRDEKKAAESAVGVKSVSPFEAFPPQLREPSARATSWALRPLWFWEARAPFSGCGSARSSE